MSVKYRGPDHRVTDKSRDGRLGVSKNHTLRDINQNKIEVLPSFTFFRSLFCAGVRKLIPADVAKAGCILSGAPVYHKLDKQPHTFTDNLESPGSLACVSLDCGRKQEESHTAMGRAYKTPHRNASDGIQTRTALL